MNKPDLTQDRELVECAEVALAAAGCCTMGDDWNYDCTLKMTPRSFLAAIDAARTHLGSGYTLPEPNDANAERLAREVVEWFSIDNFDQLAPVVKRARIRSAKEHLQALHAAFGEPEQPAPTPDCPSCGRELCAIDATAGICWRCRPWRDCPPKPPLPAEKPVRDAVSRDEQREYEELTLKFALAEAGKDVACAPTELIGIGALHASAYLAWRKQSREAACRK